MFSTDLSAEKSYKLFVNSDRTHKTQVGTHKMPLRRDGRIDRKAFESSELCAIFESGLHSCRIAGKSFRSEMRSSGVAIFRIQSPLRYCSLGLRDAGGTAASGKSGRPRPVSNEGRGMGPHRRKVVQKPLDTVLRTFAPAQMRAGDQK